MTRSTDPYKRGYDAGYRAGWWRAFLGCVFMMIAAAVARACGAL